MRLLAINRFIVIPPREIRSSPLSCTNEAEFVRQRRTDCFLRYMAAGSLPARKEREMPEKKTLRQARADKRAGKAPSTQAGAFVHEEIEHVREGKHGARSTKQVIAIGLSKARRAGVKLPPPPSSAKASTKRRAPKRARSTVSTKALSRQATSAARRRSPTARKRSAQKAARTRRRRASA